MAGSDYDIRVNIIQGTTANFAAGLGVLAGAIKKSLGKALSTAFDNTNSALRYESVLKSMGVSAKTTSKQVSAMGKAVLGTGLDMADMIDNARIMAQSLPDSEVKNATKYATALGLAYKAAGASQQEQIAANRQWSNALQKGSLTSVQLKSILSAMGPIANKTAKSLTGMNFGEMFGSKGGYNNAEGFTKFLQALGKQTGSLQKQALAASVGYDTLFKSLSDAFSLGAMDGLKKAFQSIDPSDIQALVSVMYDLGKAVGDVIGKVIQLVASIQHTFGNAGVAGLFVAVVTAASVGMSVLKQLVAKAGTSLISSFASTGSKMAGALTKGIKSTGSSGVSSAVEDFTSGAKGLEQGATSVSKSAGIISKSMVNILAAAASFALVAGGLYLLAKAGQEFAKVKWDSMGKMAAALGAFVALGAVVALIPPLAAGLIALGGAVVLAGAGMLAGGAGFNLFAKGMTALSKVSNKLPDAGKLIKVAAGVGAMVLALGGLVIPAALTGGALVAVGAGISNLANGLKTLSKVDTSNIDLKGLGKDVGSFISAIGKATNIKGGSNVIEQFLGSITANFDMSAFGKMAKGLDELGKSMSNISQYGAGFAQNAAGIGSGIRSIMDALAGISTSNNMTTLADGTVDLSKAISSGDAGSFVSFGKGIAAFSQSLQNLATYGSWFVTNGAGFATSLQALLKAVTGANIDDTVGAGFKSIAQGLATLAPQMQNIAQNGMAFAQALNGGNGSGGVTGALKKFADAMVTVFTNTNWTSALGLFDTFTQSIKRLATAMTSISTAGDVFGALGSSISTFVSSMAGITADLGLAIGNMNQLTSAANDITKALKNIPKTVTPTIKLKASGVLSTIADITSALNKLNGKTATTYVITATKSVTYKGTQVGKGAVINFAGTGLSQMYSSIKRASMGKTTAQNAPIVNVNYEINMSKMQMTMGNNAYPIYSQNIQASARRYA
jgi:tape measure domain-containing protein